MEHELTVLVSALFAEQAGLRRRLGVQGAAAERCRRHGRPLLAVVTGDGRVSAERGLSQAVRDRSVSQILVFGLGGAASPGLELGTPVFASSLTGSDGETFADVLDPAPVPEAQAAAFHTVPRILASAEDKRAHWEQAGQPTRSVVDLESAAYARVARRVGAKLRIVRVISDGFDENLPSIIEASARADGSIDPVQVALRSAVRPRTWGPLMELQGRLRRASARLATFLDALVPGPS